MKVSKMKTIATAFIKPLPKGEAWYEERVEICSTCDMNSGNMDELSFTDKLKIKTGICDDGNHCTACGCCILRKCATKTESCGLKEINKTPKWVAIETEDIDGVSIETLALPGVVSAGPKEVLYDLGAVSDNVVNVLFNLNSKDPIRFSKWSVSCGCTYVNKATQVDDRQVQIDAAISTLGFRTGLNEKTLTLEYRNKANRYQTVTIRFRIIKL